MAVVAAGLLLMAFQLYRLTGPQSAQWAAEAQQQRIRELTTYGARGWIFDAKDRPLATNEKAFAAVLVGQDAKAIQEMMPKLSLVLTSGDAAKAEEITNRVMDAVYLNKKNWQQFRPLVIKTDLSQQVVAAFTERKNEFPDVVLVEEPSRRYPNGGLAGSLLGYVGAITDEEIQDPAFKGYNADETVGKAGLELSYESYLRGQPGTTRVTIDMYGKRVGNFDETPPVSGNNLHLTLDMDLQRVAEEALAKQIEWIKQQHDAEANPTIGSVVVQDVRTGAILAMASVPTYNPNQLINPTATEWDALQKQPGFSLYNWAITGLSPGSTFKMATGFAGLENGTIGPNSILPCPAVYPRYGHPSNWLPYDDGPMNIGRALATSCNPFFWEVAYQTGIDKLNYYYDLLGFGHKTGIDLPGEDPGVNPSKASYGDLWYDGEILNVAIGQGHDLVTPLQLANYVGAIATGGTRYRPYLVDEVTTWDGKLIKKTQPQPLPPIPAKPETWKALQEGMRQGVVSAEGTPHLPMLGFPIPSAGKTGSAQTGSASGGYSQSDATTVVYAPYDNPQVAVAVIIKGGSKGSWATPVARRVLAKYFNVDDHIPPEVGTYHN